MLIDQLEHGPEIARDVLVDEINVHKLEFNQDHAGTFKYCIVTCIFDIYKLPVTLSKHLKVPQKTLFTICC